MTSSADQVIAALRSSHDELAALVADLDVNDLVRPSGASEWDVSQVLSHLGSGAVIGLAMLEASVAGDPPPDGDFNKGVWARWDAMTPAERADGFAPANLLLVERYESLDPTQRAELRIDLGFLPQPIDVATAGAFRLTEFGYHAWDVKVAFEPAATVAPVAAAVMVDHAAFIIGFIGRPDALNGRQATLAVHTTEPDRSFGLSLGSKISVVDVPARPDGELRAATETWLRLAAGRLAPRYTPSTVSLTGPLDLDDLRNVFPGF